MNLNEMYHQIPIGARNAISREGLSSLQEQLEFIPENNLKKAREAAGLQAKDVVEV